MLNIHIIGAGVAGLAIQKELQRRGFNLSGSEKEASPGGRQRFGAHRIYSETARELLSAALPDLTWTTVEEASVTFRKGGFEPLLDTVTGLGPGEQSLLGNPFFEPSLSYAEMARRLAPPAEARFFFKEAATSIELESKTLVLSSGASRPFEFLLWTDSLSSLLKATGQGPLPQSKKTALSAETGCITWDLVTSLELFQNRNSLLFGFRYKDLKLRALGTPGKSMNPSEQVCHWTVFLEDSLLEDHEELAKVCRAFKRELSKQFPSLLGSLVRETLGFHPEWGPPAARSIPSLEVFDGIACVGSDCRSEALSPGNDAPFNGLDRELINCQDFLDHILPTWLERSNGKGALAQAPNPELELTIR
jgi:hypothetical protein